MAGSEVRESRHPLLPRFELPRASTRSAFGSRRPLSLSRDRSKGRTFAWSLARDSTDSPRGRRRARHTSPRRVARGGPSLQSRGMDPGMKTAPELRALPSHSTLSFRSRAARPFCSLHWDVGILEHRRHPLEMQPSCPGVAPEARARTMRMRRPAAAQSQAGADGPRPLSRSGPSSKCAYAPLAGGAAPAPRSKERDGRWPRPSRLRRVGSSSDRAGRRLQKPGCRRNDRRETPPKASDAHRERRYDLLKCIGVEGRGNRQCGLSSPRDDSVAAASPPA